MPLSLFYTVVQFLHFMLLARALPSPDTGSSPVADTHRHVILDYTSQEDARLAAHALEAIRKGATEYGEVKVITIKGFASLLNQNQLNESLLRLSNPLEEVHYELNTPIPVRTLSAIAESHSDSRLYYTIPFQYWDDFDSEVPDVQSGREPLHRKRHQLRKNILGSPNLYSLKANLLYGPQDNLEDLQLVYDIVTSCPNLRELSLSIEREGCIVARYPYAFDFTKDEKPFPPLEVLRLSGYRFEAAIDGGRRQLREFGQNGLAYGYAKTTELFGLLMNYVLPARNETQEPQPDNFDAWMERVEFTNLKELDLSPASPSVLQRMSPTTANLERLHLHSGYHRDTTGFLPFLRNLTKPLEQLTIWDGDNLNYDELLEAIKPMGANLKSLTVSVKENGRKQLWEEIPRSSYFNETHLVQLGEQNPGIAALGFDIARDSFDPEIIRAAALLPSLAHFTIYVESPTDHAYVPTLSRDSQFNRTTAPGLFNDINTFRQREHLEMLSRLEIIVGPWDLRDVGGDLPSTSPVGRWVCRLSSGGETLCFGGNEREDGGRWRLEEAYEENWGD